LHPDGDARWQENDASCVLRVSSGEHALLLTGDLEQPGEQALLQRYGDGLQSTLVQVGHHGSRTSSSPQFVRAVAPAWALIARGYRNRFRFPAPEVVGRWSGQGAEILDTVETGSIRILLDPQAGVSIPRQQRQVQARYWRP
jgi:competence protein ComEC